MRQKDLVNVFLGSNTVSSPNSFETFEAKDLRDRTIMFTAKIAFDTLTTAIGVVFIDPTIDLLNDLVLIGSWYRCLCSLPIYLLAKLLIFDCNCCISLLFLLLSLRPPAVLRSYSNLC